VADDIRTLSDVLARDPASLVYADLAEALRRRGDVAQALRVATQGLMRHPEHVAGLDCLGRIHADRGALAEARDAWARALAVAPSHAGALKGMAFALFREGDAPGAEALLERASAADPSDEGIRRALETVRGGATDVTTAETVEWPAPAPFRPGSAGEAAAAGGAAEAAAPPAPAGAAGAVAPAEGGEVAGRPSVFHGLEGATADILLFDDRGLVVAGGLGAADGGDAAELAAAALAGVSGEAGRTAEYLGLGAWGSIVAEAEAANLVLSPVGRGALLLVRRDRSVPVGLARRVAERALAAARGWLERQGA
jgi:predicted regulator of Ras-like GTPase activity (Roadblock/LC7/MglB family)